MEQRPAPAAFVPSSPAFGLPRSLSGTTDSLSDLDLRVGLGLATATERIDNFRRMFCEETSCRSYKIRMAVARVIMAGWFEWSLGFAVVAQLVLAAAETDFNAHDRELPHWCTMLQVAFVTVYVIEITLRIFVWRTKFFQNNGNMFDLSVVALDFSALLAEYILEDRMPSVAFIRCLRMLKLARTARILKQFRELYVIAYSLAGVLKSIFWESCVLFVVLTIASIVAVELIHPINMELAAEGLYADCERCPRAFESVMQSNLTFFQTMVAADNWGLVIIPIIEKRPDTAVFFLFLTLLVVLGLMNLILSAIVDKASEVRHIVEATSLLEKRAVIDESKLRLVSVCEEMDPDNSGSFTIDELKRVLTEPIFKEAMRVMDVGPEELDAIYGMMDTDNNGEISYYELADSLQRMKAQDDHMLLILIQRTLKHFYKKLEGQIEKQGSVMEELRVQKEMLQEIGDLEAEVMETLEAVVPAHCESPRKSRRHTPVLDGQTDENGRDVVLDPILSPGSRTRSSFRFGAVNRSNSSGHMQRRLEELAAVGHEHSEGGKCDVIEKADSACVHPPSSKAVASSSRHRDQGNTFTSAKQDSKVVATVSL